MNKEMNGTRFPLSLSQLNILNLERSLSGTSVNNISTTIRITGRLDFPMLQKSISLVLESDPSLRTRLVEENGEVLQYHAPYVKETFPVYDFSNTSREGIENWENAVTRELIPLFDGPLYRFVLFRDSEKGGGVLVKLHHIIADGWSQVMLCNKIGQTYIRLIADQTPELPEAPDYQLHVLEEQEYLASKAFVKDERYWQETVSQMGEPSVLKSVNSATISPVGRRISFNLPEILNHAIYSYCEKNRVAPFAVFYMALAIYFKRNGGANHFTIGVPIFNRTNYQFKQSTGMFVTTLPFYNEINDEWTLNEFNDKLAERWFEMLRHQRYPFSRICQLAGNDGRLFHIALSYQDSKIYESRDVSVSLSGRWHYCGYQAEQLTIHLTNLYNHRQYAVDYGYLAQFFTEDEITALHRNLCHILSEALSEPDRPIYRLNVLSLDEKEKLLYTFNKTDRYLEERSVYQALMANNTRHMNRVALIHNGERMTYGSLFRRGTQFASALSKLENPGEKLAAILLPRKFDLPAALIGSLEAGYAYMILSESLPTERIKTILSQSKAGVLLTDEKGKLRMADCDLPVITTKQVDRCEAVLCKAREENAALGDQLAYVVYTSGSTGEPKGVEITHRNLLNLAQEMESVYGQGAVLSVCNVGFDAFMLESIVALLNGRTIVLPDESDLESPERLAALMNGYAVGFFSITPSRLSALLQSETFRRVMWRMESIVCGGEPFPPELLKKLKAYTQAKIYNQYGPSETTVAVSMKELSNSDKITVGSPMGNCKLYVLDQWMNPLPIGGNGRLFVGGTCVGRGYRNRPELTAQAFRDNPFISDDRIYDTGDLAYWTPHGEVVLTGRADRQVKLRGLRIEPQEIAACLESHPLVSSAFAKICQINGQQILGAYYTSDCTISEAELLSHAATYLPEYMIPAFLLKVSHFPTTVNGKVDEAKLPLPSPTDDRPSQEASPTAEIITDIFRQVLSFDGIHAGSDYFLCGGNSLNALECIIQIEEKFGKKIRVADLYACRNAARLAQMIDGDSHATSAPLPSAPSAHLLKKSPKQQEYPLTPTQQGIYVQSVLDPSGLSYNMPGAFLLEKALDADKLTSAFTALIREDAIFRTVFVQGTDGICARILDRVDFSLQTLSADNYDDACAEFLRPFDLTKAPLLRAALWQSEKGEHYLFVDSHHIISDGMSTSIVLQRLSRAYEGKKPAADWDFYDYVYTTQAEKGEKVSSDLDYWTSHLANTPDPLILPSDFVRPAKFDFKGGELEHCFTAADSRALEKFCHEQGYSEFVLFLAAYGLLLSALSGSDDLVVGTPVAGRNHLQSANICGPFINTLPLRLTRKSDQTVCEWLKQVQSEVTGLLDHQQVGLEEIISALNLPRGEMNALYRVMLTQSPVDEDKFALGGDPMTFRAISTGIVKMDMILELAKKDSRHALRFSYAASLFEAETIRFYGRCMEQIVKELIKNGDRPLDSLSLLSAGDQETYIDIPNYRVTPFVNRPVHRILKSRSDAAPDDIAIIWHNENYTFAQLERRAMAIAAFLEEKGVQPGQCVGLCLKRTPDMLAAMYGVLKAGCAYMFMLESFPASRLQYMLEISNAAILLYDQAPEELLNGSLPCEACLLPEGEADHYTDRPVSDDCLANVLFTSGSTGQPKGVMLRHRSVSNLCAQMKSLLDPIAGRVLCSTNSVFDCFIVETVIALALGRTVVLADEEEMMLPWKLAQLVETYQTGIFEMTPSRLQMCLGNDAFCRAAKQINIVLLGGEVVTTTLRDKFYQHSSGMLMNMYGPTEATVFTTMGHAKPGEHITIGAPLQNTRVYVLDQNLRPVLPTACGELYIAGECLSAGYISRPCLTESSFVPDPNFPGQKMYRSGDLVRQRLDGRFDYVGRKDSQVKLNGQRVELTEITGAIEQTGLVKQAATVAIRNDDGSMELRAFYVPEEETVTDDEILSKLAQLLPPYMIPSGLVKLSQMPVTATNKIDLQTLKKMATEGCPASEHKQPPMLPAKQSERPEETAELTEELDTLSEEPVEQNDESAELTEEPVETAKSAEQTAEPTDLPVEKDLPRSPVTPDVAYVLSVWNKVLSTPATDPDLSFFKLGGSSMAALNALSYYYNDGFELSLSEFYQESTANGQARLLQERRTRIQSPLPAEENPSADCKNAVLVTGATGFFGIHLVNELVEQGNTKIVCLLRDGSTSRMESYLTRYFGKDRAQALMRCIEVIQGDITLPNLGLSDAAYQALAAWVSEIFHCAADVRHYAADREAYLKTNVDGTRNVLALAECADASFYHISTCSVSGDTLKNGDKGALFTENDYDIGQNWESNIYVKSKFLAEGLVFDAAKKGLRTKIFRLGRLVGRAVDGKFQINPETNAFYLFMKGFSRIGALSQAEAAISLELTPVDISAKEVLALRNGSSAVYHIMNSNPPTFGEVMEAINPDCRTVDAFEFSKIFREKCLTLDRELFAVIMNNWQVFGQQGSAISVTNRITSDELAKAGFTAPEYTLETILKDFGKEENR